MNKKLNVRRVSTKIRAKIQNVGVPRGSDFLFPPRGTLQKLMKIEKLKIYFPFLTLLTGRIDFSVQYMVYYRSYRVREYV